MSKLQLAKLSAFGLFVLSVVLVTGCSNGDSGSMSQEGGAMMNDGMMQDSMKSDGMMKDSSMQGNGMMQDDKKM